MTARNREESRPTRTTCRILWTKPSRNKFKEIADSAIQVKSSYCYLGITFDASGRFGTHITELKRKSAIATVYISRLIAQCGKAVNSTQSKLFNAKFLACLMYGSEVWGLSSLDELETIQQRIFKRTFNLHSTIPRYVIRNLFNIRSQRLLIIAKSVNWFNKLVRMPDNIWLKRCLVRMISRQQGSWLSRLKQVIREAGGELVFDEATGGIPPSLLVSLTASEVSEDLRRCQESSHCPTYASLCTKFSDINNHFTIVELRLPQGSPSLPALLAGGNDWVGQIRKENLVQSGGLPLCRVIIVIYVIPNY